MLILHIFAHAEHARFFLTLSHVGLNPRPTIVMSHCKVYVQVPIGKSFRVLILQAQLFLDRFPDKPLVFLDMCQQMACYRSKCNKHLFVVSIQLAAIDVCPTLQIWFYFNQKADKVGNSLCINRPSDLPASMDITLKMTFSTLCTGLQRSEACSYIVGSSPGVCSMEMQTLPSA